MDDMTIIQTAGTRQSWKGMMARCFNARDDRYAKYGARGITVCERWRSFHAFLEDMGERPAERSIERIDNSGNYSCGKCEECRLNGVVTCNCRWATRSEQQRNRRTNRIVSFGERSMTVIEWAEETGLKPETIRGRLREGWSAEEALTTPPLKSKYDRRGRGK